MELYAHCRGAFLLSQQVPENERVTDESAESGTRIHKADEESDLTLLSDVSEQEMLIRIREKEEEIYKKWVSDYDLDGYEIQIVRERRLWLLNDAASAKLDMYAIAATERAIKIALIIDVKSGRKATTPSPKNLQLRTQLVALTDNEMLDVVRVAIVQPMVKAQSVCDYTAKDIEAARAEIIRLVTLIDRPDAVRTPGYWCERCPARHICPEVKHHMTAMSELRGLRWDVMAPEQKLIWWQKGKVVKKIIEQIEQNVKADLTNDPAAIPGLEKRPAFEVREITDTIGVYDALLYLYGVSQIGLNKWFNESTRLSIGAVEDFICEKSGRTKEEAKAWVERYLSQFITKVPREGRIVAKEI